jgi:hypothetical protein
MGEAKRRKTLGSTNTHDMEHLERVDLGCEFLARREVMLPEREGTTHNRVFRRSKDQERRSKRRRRARADHRAERNDPQTQLELARANILGADAWKATAAAVRLYNHEHAALVAGGMTAKQAHAEMDARAVREAA